MAGSVLVLGMDSTDSDSSDFASLSNSSMFPGSID